MPEIIRIALRNLTRYKRRTLLTGLLIAFGTTAVILFGAVSSSFTGAVIGQITDSMLGHIQVHKKGYVDSILNLPLTLNLTARQFARVKKAADSLPGVAAVTPVLKFGAMLSNYTETTSIRLNGIDPNTASSVLPALRSRIHNGHRPGPLVRPGEILVPETLAHGLQLKMGQTVALVATNKDGSVNGVNLKVAGIVDKALGPGGWDGYLHISDAARLLRIKGIEASEIILRLKDFTRLMPVTMRLKKMLGRVRDKQGRPVFEVHPWKALSPFANIAKMIDVMSLFIQVILIAVVLVGILNVMMMSVYERVREIGTMSAIGVTPGKVLALFVSEGGILGLASALAGTLVGAGIVWLLHTSQIHIVFGHGQDWFLEPRLALSGVVSVILIVVVVSLLASLQPAAKAARLQPTDALRHV